jgi:chloride channel 3/4/5
LRIRRRRSARGRIANSIDRSIGWIIVTIVGFLTAVIAFVIVRGEQWLFDIKTGYCSEGWWRAQRFCCPMSVDSQSIIISRMAPEIDMCDAWTTWADAFGPKTDEHGFPYGIESWTIEYISYTVIAVRALSASNFLLTQFNISLP